MTNQLISLFLLLSAPNASPYLIESKELSRSIIGQWKLIKKGNSSSTISLKHENPISILIIENCQDNQELTHSNPIIKEGRKINLFRNIRIIEIRQDGIIDDTAYPIALAYPDNRKFHISSYGRVHKKYYMIDQITKDSIIIEGGDVYIKSTHPYSETYFSSKSDPDIQMMNKILADKKKKPTRRRKKSN